LGFAFDEDCPAADWDAASFAEESFFAIIVALLEKLQPRYRYFLFYPYLPFGDASRFGKFRGIDENLVVLLLEQIGQRVSGFVNVKVL
jgi:hypothetical protein